MSNIIISFEKSFILVLVIKKTKNIDKKEKHNVTESHEVDGLTVRYYKEMPLIGGGFFFIVKVFLNYIL